MIKKGAVYFCYKPLGGQRTGTSKVRVTSVGKDGRIHVQRYMKTVGGWTKKTWPIEYRDLINPGDSK